MESENEDLIEELNNMETFSLDGNSLPRVFEIGTLLNKKGGFKQMSKVLEGISGSIRRRELEFCWDGIGSWRA